jgi:hypothetical protein
MTPVYCPDCIAEGRKREATHRCAACRRDRCDAHVLTDPHYVPPPPPDDKTLDLFGPEPEVL